MPSCEQDCHIDSTVSNTIDDSLRGGVFDWLDDFLTPNLDLTRLSKVDLIVVHGGSGKHGVAAGILFQDLVNSEKKRLLRKPVDLSPPMLFSGRWSTKTPEDQKPRSRCDQVVSQATYMKEIACHWGVPEQLMLTEDESLGTRSSIVNCARMLKTFETQPQTILFVSPHMFARRHLLLWQHYTRGIDFLPVSASVIQRDDDMEVRMPDEPVQGRIRDSERIRELVKTVATGVLIGSGVW